MDAISVWIGSSPYDLGFNVTIGGDICLPESSNVRIFYNIEYGPLLFRCKRKHASAARIQFGAHELHELSFFFFTCIPDF